MDRYSFHDGHTSRKDELEVKESLTGSSHSNIDGLGVNKATMDELATSEDD